MSKKAAKAELARRTLAKRRFGEFCRFMVPAYPETRHLELLGERLEQVERFVASGGQEGIGRLMVFMPPRYWKSVTCSVLFPQWFLGRNPDQRVILASYAAGLATGFSRKVRNAIGSERYGGLFGARGTVDGAPRELAKDSRAADEWELAAPYRGGMASAGVGGGITGKGANLLIVDDPVKDRKEAESETTREGIWDWWTSTAFTRLEKHAAVVVVMTRWHGGDLAGRLLGQEREEAPPQSPPRSAGGRGEETPRGAGGREETPGAGGREEASPPQLGTVGTTQSPPQGRGEGRGWSVLMLPAVWDGFGAEEREEQPWLPEVDPLGRQPGEALWPEKHDEAELGVLKSAVGLYNWAALYQQVPYLRVGGMFQRDWFPIVEKAPESVETRVRYWDKAATGGGGAYTSGVLISRTTEGLVYVEHVVRGQWSTFQREERMLRTANLDKEHRGRVVHWHEQEPGSAGVDSAKATNAKLADAGHEAHFERATGSKEVRAGPWSSACEAGLARLVRGGWNGAFVEEHVAFPKGPFKDQVDAGSGAYGKVSGEIRIHGQVAF